MNQSPGQFGDAVTLRANQKPGEPGGVSPGVLDRRPRNPEADATGLAWLHAPQLIVVAFSLITVLLATSLADAASNSVTIESSTMQPSVVIGRPMLTWWDVKIQGSGLLVGQFRFVVKHENQVVATSETEEMTLNGPEQRIRVMLPAIDNVHQIDQLQVDISFHGKSFSGKLGEHVLRIPFMKKKVFLGLVGESRILQKRSPQRDNLLNRLRFENLVSKSTGYHSADDDLDPVKTVFASVDSSDLPAEPLVYCGYDLVILFGEQFRSLRKPQLDALLAWIRAGGSLYVETGGVLESYHVEFLRSLVADDRQQINFLLDPAGRLPHDTVPLDQPAASVECGIGHAVIRTSDPDREIPGSKAYWIAIAGPLWKFRLVPVELTPTEKLIVGRNGQPTLKEVPNRDPFGLALTNLNQFRLSQGQLLDRLIPEGIRMVPLWTLALILSAFVGLIGPGDYFVLGWLRARKLTWVTFPTATIGVTAFTLWLSNSYMSTLEVRRAAIILDLDRRGEIVRTNRFELLFIPATRRVTTDVEKGLFMPLNTAIVNANDLLQEHRSIQPCPDIQGRIPTQYTAAQDLPKWTPQLNRLLWIPGTAPRPEVDWSQFQLALTDTESIRRHEILQKLVVATQNNFGPKAMFACFTGNDGWTYDRSPGWQSKRTREGKLYDQYQPAMAAFESIAPQAQDEPAFFRWIYQASVVMPNPGLFAVTKQTAPKGDARCGDLLLLDSTDPNAWLLVVVVPENDDYFVYRKLMRFEN